MTDSFPVKNSVFLRIAQKFIGNFIQLPQKHGGYFIPKPLPENSDSGYTKNPVIKFSIAVGLKSIHSRFFRNSSKHNPLINIIVKLLYPGFFFALIIRQQKTPLLSAHC